MARKYGKKNIIKVDVLSYNLGLIGLSGIGKSTLAKNVCEKLAGENGYLAIDCGKENGHEAIADIVSETIGSWNNFCKIIDDIIENRTTDYAELKVVIIDTIDDLFAIAEKEAIRLSNRKNSEKQTDSINSAFGGFGRGQDKTIELVINKLWELKEVGIGIFVIGHTKTKTLSDPITGQDYEMLTTDITNKYFNSIKNKLHILGVASIERAIKSVNMGKNAFTGKDIIKGDVQGEKRFISFRDDSYSIDSKSRFAEIKPKVKLDPDEFINAIKEAIELEHNKQSTTPIKETEQKQAKEKEKAIKDNHKDVLAAKDKQKLEDMIEIIIDKFERYKSEPYKLKPVSVRFKEFGYTKFDQIKNITLEQAEELLKLL